MQNQLDIKPGKIDGAGVIAHVDDLSDMLDELYSLMTMMQSHYELNEEEHDIQHHIGALVRFTQDVRAKADDVAGYVVTEMVRSQLGTAS